MSPEPQPEQEPERVVIRKMYKMPLDCLYCDSYSEMEGGPVNDDVAKFLCENCGNLNTVKWVFDF